MFDNLEQSDIILFSIISIVISLAILYYIIKGAVRSANKEQVELMRQQNLILKQIMENSDSPIDSGGRVISAGSTDLNNPEELNQLLQSLPKK